MTEHSVLEQEINTTWGTSLDVFYCSHCHSAHLAADEIKLAICPVCLRATLTSQPERIRRERPELVIPFAIGRQRAEDALAAWCKGMWLRPGELNAKGLGQRLQRYFLPLWLVDGDVEAAWQAEVGYDYQAASFREQYQGGQWLSQEITETRTRWQVRVGTLDRHYDNIAVPALTQHEQWMSRLGGYSLRTRKPYSARIVAEGVVRIPDYEPDAAWIDAESALNRSAAVECQAASGAEHIRNWGMRAQYKGLNWTQLLVPAYVTYYREGEDVYPVWVNGQNGHIYGIKLMSMQKATVASLVIGVIALLCFLLGLVLAVIGIGILLVLLSLPLGLLAFGPLIWVWASNRQAQRQMAEL
ncbi:MAG: hypothetical protein JXA89_26185 [Anaerolineae bacterium]|nr:hypothetical protein [Anaerolineae bacterium]